MNAEIITIGDEILIGQIIDTNSAWLGQQFSALGIRINKITSVSDRADEIEKSVHQAIENHSIVIITGGLGPTKDDLTKHTLVKFFNTTLVLSNEVLEDVTALFASLGKTVTELNRQQAMVPENCKVLRNKKGTAPGMAWNINEKLIVSLPGVPYEMKWLFENEVTPLIKSLYALPAIEHLSILTQGIGESTLAERIEEWENNLPDNVKLAYLPAAGAVRLRLSAYGKDNTKLAELNKALADKVMPFLGNHFYGYNNDTLESVIADLFFKNKKTLGIAESCTGGNVAHKITRIAGCSSFFKGGFVTYSNELKISLLEVEENTLDQYGAVSKQVVEQMLLGVKKKLNIDYAIAVSGVAGPGGGTIEKPVGLVWIGILSPENQFIKEFNFGNDRLLNIERATLTALNLLRLALLNKLFV